MPRILANDGMHEAGLAILREKGYSVDTDHIAQEELAQRLNDYDAILVRSATKVRQKLIDQCPNLRFIGRGGVGMDNIDVSYAREKGLRVQNTPAASSQSVAELVFAHLFTGVRFLHDANRRMPSEGDQQFKVLKKGYSKGIELQGKQLGIIGFGGIGQAVAKIAIGLGMNVIPYRRTPSEEELTIPFYNGLAPAISVSVKTQSLDALLAESDFITVHVPFKSGNPPIIGADEFARMKDGVLLINTARGGAVDESALLDALNNGKVRFAGIDVYENEPQPRVDLLGHPNVSVTPHIGGSTVEAQARVWEEMAGYLIDFFG